MFSLLPQLAVAQSGPEEPGAQDTAVARALFEEGVMLADAEQWAEAADRFQRSLELRGSPVVAYNLASALVQLERLVEASELLQKVRRDETAPAAARDAARALLDRVQPRLGRLTIRLDGDPSGVTVWIDGREIPTQAIGVSMPVDPGRRTIRVRRGDDVVAERQLTVLSGAGAETRLEVPPAPPPPEPQPEEPPVEETPTGFRPGDAFQSELPDPTDDANDEDAAEVPTPEQVARVAVRRPSGRRAPRFTDEEDTSLLENPWFWGGVGAGSLVLAIGVTVTVLVLSADDEIAPAFNGTTDPPLVELGR